MQSWNPKFVCFFVLPIGSGIYTPESVKMLYYYDMETESGQLMLSELKSRPRSELTSPAAVDWSAYAKGVKPFSSELLDFPGTIYFDEFTFMELKRNTGNYTVCQKDLHCHLTYKMSEKQTDETYALGAFDGLHTVEGQYYLQVEMLTYVRTFSLLVFLLGHHCISLKIQLDSINWNNVIFITEFLCPLLPPHPRTPYLFSLSKNRISSLGCKIKT